MLKTYTIDTGETFDAHTHREAHAELCRRLSISGPRALMAWGPGAVEVYATLTDDGEDYIKTADGRTIFHW